MAARRARRPCSVCGASLVGRIEYSIGGRRVCEACWVAPSGGSRPSTVERTAQAFGPLDAEPLEWIQQMNIRQWEEGQAAASAMKAQRDFYRRRWLVRGLHYPALGGLRRDEMRRRWRIHTEADRDDG